MISKKGVPENLGIVLKSFQNFLKRNYTQHSVFWRFLFLQNFKIIKVIMEWTAQIHDPIWPPVRV